MPKMDRDVCFRRLTEQVNRAGVMDMILSDIQGDDAFTDKEKEQIEHTMQALLLAQSTFIALCEAVQERDDGWECNEF